MSKYGPCPDCGRTQRLSALAYHQRVYCKKTDAVRREQRREERTCPAPECGKPFTPKAARQITCSAGCTRAHAIHLAMIADAAEAWAADLKELAPIRRGEEALAAQVAEVTARLHSPERTMQLWATCLDVPSLVGPIPNP